MNLLIIGGTLFVGRNIIEAALARGHRVTMFNRGHTAPNLFPDVEKLHGDRDQDLSALEGRRWDAVIDTCGYFPNSVGASARLLRHAVEHYTFISTIAVYADFSKVGIVESDPLSQLPPDKPEAAEEITGESYGPLKGLCEKAVEESLPGRSLIVRAGLIVGPYDPTGRFTYWVRRVSHGGKVLAPGNPNRQVQIIDARDLADWLLRMTESRSIGVFNCTGPDYRLTMGLMLEECKTISGSDAELVWVDGKFLLDNQVGQWDEMPLWLSEDNANVAGLLSVDVSKVLAAGITFRPLSETIRDTLAWETSRTEPPILYKVRGMQVPLGGIPAEREAELLKKWMEQRRD